MRALGWLGAVLLGGAAGWFLGSQDTPASPPAVDADRVAALEAERDRLREALAQRTVPALEGRDGAESPRGIEETVPGITPDAPPAKALVLPPGISDEERDLLIAHHAQAEFIRSRRNVTGDHTPKALYERIPDTLKGTPRLWLQALRVAVEANDLTMQVHAIYALRSLGTEGGDLLAEAFDDPETPAALRQRVWQALIQAHPAKAQEVATRFLEDAREPSPFRTQVIEGFAQGRPTTVPASVRSLAEDAETPSKDRRAALAALMSADPEAALALLQFLLASRDADEVGIAWHALAHTRDPRYRPLLLEQLPHVPEAQRKNFAAALAAMKGASWGDVQATGAPDTVGHGDQPTAWASLKAQEGLVTVEASFPVAVHPQQIRVHETFNAGAIQRIEARIGGTWEELWAAKADGVGGARWFAPPLHDPAGAIDTIRLTLDTNVVQGWNEIDAIELVGDGRRQWASAVRSSSCYARR